MTVTPSYNANIIIKNNKIDHGMRYDDALSPLSYIYDDLAIITGSAFIENNIFAAPGVDSNMLNTIEGSCIIRNNKFIRHTTSINSYISHQADSKGTSEITDNIFDSSSVDADGYNEQLVLGLNPGSIYTRNKNQTGFIYLPVFDSLIFPSDDELFELKLVNANATEGWLMDKGNVATNLITLFKPATGVTSPNFFVISKTFQLGYFLEKGMEVVSARISGYRTTGTFTLFSGGSYFAVFITSHDPNVNMIPTEYGVGTSKATRQYRYSINSSDALTALSSSAQSTIFDTESIPTLSDGNYFGFNQPDLFRAGNGYHLQAEFSASIEFDTNDWLLVFSPIEIKYKW